jgi:DNA processing protein
MAVKPIGHDIYTENMLRYRALQLTNGLGNRSIRYLVSQCGGVEKVFLKTPGELIRIEGIGKKVIGLVKNAKNHLPEAKKEYTKCAKMGIRMIACSDPEYPHRLKVFDDSPVVLFVKGDNIPLNKNHTIGIVGTRNATAFGRSFTERLVFEWKHYHPCIVSGLAYGIDINAHQAALNNHLPTIGILGNGLDFVYPSVHRNIAHKMLENGGLISEFPPGTKPDRQNFPMRNRIVAMLSDALVVVEAAKKGGALITANMAFDYNKEVYAVPGKPGDPYSEGCNDLIGNLKASLLHRPEQLPSDLNWETGEPSASRMHQAELFLELTEDEKNLIGFIGRNRQTALEEICIHFNQKPSFVLGKLLEMELKGLVKSLPGNRFQGV